MTLNIMHPLYVVAGFSIHSEPGSQWMPISTQAYPVKERAEIEAEKMARRLTAGEKCGVIEYTAEGAQLVGQVFERPQA
ncbi:MAG: hypothetical protein ACRC3F_05370 [Billgrantia desiderata]